MSELDCYAFVEDAPSREVALKLIEFRNQFSSTTVRFKPGFPNVLRGAANLRKKCPALLEMARQTPVFCITDLDTCACPSALIAAWLSGSRPVPPPLPEKLVFRVAVREIESWIMADKHALASHLGFAAANFPDRPDELDDPKRFLIDLIRAKGKKRFHTEMLPRGSAHIGPRYNEVLCNFVSLKWSPDRASQASPSLKRAVEALHRV